MSINIGVYDSSDNKWDLPYTQIQNLNISKGKNGIKSCEFFMPMALRTAMALYPAILNDEVRVSWFSEHFFKGRIEDIKITAKGLHITALGYWRSIDDITYSELWSTTDYKLWRPVTGAEIAGTTPDKYNIDFNGRIYMSLKKGQIYTNGTDACSVVLKIPHGSSKQIIGFSLDFTANLPNPVGVGSWDLAYQTADENYASRVATTISTMAGIAFSRTYNFVVTACDYLLLTIYNNTTAPDTPAGEDGANYIQITNLRVVTATTNRINTTLGTTFGAGGSNTVTPASMANIYVGQQLQIAHSTNTSETITVTDITSTTFTAIFAVGHNAADAVNAHVVYPYEIVQDILTQAYNSNGQLSNSQTFIENQSLDIFDAYYEDERPSNILNDLAGKGDTADTPVLYETGVDVNKQLYFRPVGDAGAVYYVDITSVDTVISLENVYNTMYGIYRDAYDRKLRTAISYDDVSITYFGVLRANFVDVNSSNNQQAILQRNTKLTDEKNAQAKAAITFDRIYNVNGGLEPLTKVNPGDTFIIRNYPFTLISTTVIDRIKSFRISEVRLNILTNELTVTPEDFIPTLDTMLRRANVRNR